MLRALCIPLFGAFAACYNGCGPAALAGKYPRPSAESSPLAKERSSAGRPVA